MCKDRKQHDRVVPLQFRSPARRNLSPILFALFINDLVIQIKSLRKGIQIQHGSDTDHRHVTDISLLLYADDIALIAGTESDMQAILDLLTEWCNNWNLQININKSKVMHFRKRKMKQSPFIFQLENNALDYVPSYKYLGVIFDENKDFKTNTENLAVRGECGWTINFKRKTQNKYGSTLEPYASYGNGQRPNHQKGFSVGPSTMW